MLDKLIFILGPTAVGKTNLAINIANEYNTEIISADSRQCYKYLNIGTAKPNESEMKGIKHHLIDFMPLESNYSAGKFVNDFEGILEINKNKYTDIIISGGTGLYINSFCNGLDDMPFVESSTRINLNKEFKEFGLKKLLEELKFKDPFYYQIVDKSNHRRVIRALEVIRSGGKAFSYYTNKNRKQKIGNKYKIIKIGLNIDRDKLYNRINRRVEIMFEKGLLKEVESLYDYRHLNSLNTIGYKELFDYMSGEVSLSQAKELIKRNTRRYAKRQLTWFNRDKEIIWLDPKNYLSILDHIGSF